MLYPELANFDCEECRKWVLDDDGNPKTWGSTGKFIPRGNCPPPCECDPPGFCKKKNNNIEEFTFENRLVYQRYLEAKALGPTEADKNDSVFRYYCSLLQQEEEACKRILLHWAIWGNSKKEK